MYNNHVEDLHIDHPSEKTLILTHQARLCLVCFKRGQEHFDF